MYNKREILETIQMIEEQNLDVRTITMGISLIDCMDTDIYKSCEKVYNKIYNYAKDLVSTGEKISKKYGIPIINKRVAVTPIANFFGNKIAENKTAETAPEAPMELYQDAFR